MLSKWHPPLLLCQSHEPVALRKENYVIDGLTESATAHESEILANKEPVENFPFPLFKQYLTISIYNV
jgi:hypothetical protein